MGGITWATWCLKCRIYADTGGIQDMDLITFNDFILEHKQCERAGHVRDGWLSDRNIKDWSLVFYGDAIGQLALSLEGEDGPG